MYMIQKIICGGKINDAKIKRATTETILLEWRHNLVVFKESLESMESTPDRDCLLEYLDMALNSLRVSNMTASINGMAELEINIMVFMKVMSELYKKYHFVDEKVRSVIPTGLPNKGIPEIYRTSQISGRLADITKFVSLLTDIDIKDQINQHPDMPLKDVIIVFEKILLLHSYLRSVLLLVHRNSSINDVTDEEYSECINRIINRYTDGKLVPELIYHVSVEAIELSKNAILSNYRIFKKPSLWFQ